jgi:TPR repeat protein
VKVDYDKALRHHSRAAQHGQVDGQNYLGLAYYHGGIGVPVNHKTAREWFRKAAEKGLAESQYNYAVMLGKGEGKQLERYFKIKK